MSTDKTQTERPDDAAGDSVTNTELITRVHAFMCALLAFLGFNALPNETTLDMLDTLTQWLVDAKAVRDGRQGITSRLWWEAFKAAWLVQNAEAAGRAADAAIAEFGRRFVPVVTEEDRDTLNTGDFDAMRTELDQADRYRGEIVDAIDGRLGERAFMHPRIIDELRAERDALLAANKHHASEIEGVRKERDELKAQLAGAIVLLPKPQNVEPGQRWAIVMTAGETAGSIAPRVRSWYISKGITRSRLEFTSESPSVRAEMYYLGTDKV